METGKKLKVRYVCSVLNEHINRVEVSLYTFVTNTKIKSKSYFINGTNTYLFKAVKMLS
jgi:hypothetical protein